MKLLTVKTGKVQKRKRMSNTAKVMSRAEICVFIVRWQRTAMDRALAKMPAGKIEKKNEMNFFLMGKYMDFIYYCQ